MAQFVIYSQATALIPRIKPLSDAIPEAPVTGGQLLANEHFHRLVPPRPGLIQRAPGRQPFANIEMSMFRGRSTAAKMSLIAELYRATSALDNSPTASRSPSARRRDAIGASRGGRRRTSVALPGQTGSIG